MKIIRLSFAILSLACIAHGATNEAFEITSYFPDKGTVWIEYNGVRTNRPFSSFSAEEQKQIAGWRTDQEFESSGLNVEIEENNTRTRSDYADGQTKGTTETISYEVTVLNDTDAVLNNIQIECRTFYLQDITQSRLEGGDKYCRINQFTLSIAPGETRKFKTADVLIRNLRKEEYGSPPFPSFTTYTKDDLEGFFVSVSRQDRTGEVHSKTYEKGRVPKTERWVGYKESVAKSVIREAPTAVVRRPGTAAADDFNITKLTELAEIGDYLSAYKLCEHYSQKKDLIR